MDNTGAALAAMVDRELVVMRQQAARNKPQPQKSEMNTGAVIQRLTKAVMPAVARDARALQRITAENEIARRNRERAEGRA